MKRWIIDRYNKGQDVYYYQSKDEDPNAMMDVLLFKGTDKIASVVIEYDFLFYSVWGFAKAFWKGVYYLRPVNRPKECYQYHLQEMAIAPDIEEYLEQFKEAAQW